MCLLCGVWSRSQSSKLFQYNESREQHDPMTHCFILFQRVEGKYDNFARLTLIHRHHYYCFASTSNPWRFRPSFGLKHQLMWCIGRSLPCIKHALHKLWRIMDPNCLEFPNSKIKRMTFFRNLQNLDTTRFVLKALKVGHDSDSICTGLFRFLHATSCVDS